MQFKISRGLLVYALPDSARISWFLFAAFQTQEPTGKLQILSVGPTMQHQHIEGDSLVSSLLFTFSFINC